MGVGVAMQAAGFVLTLSSLLFWDRTDLWPSIAMQIACVAAGLPLSAVGLVICIMEA